MSDFQQDGAALWGRFNGGEAGTIWYYQSLAAFFEERLPGKLSGRLSAAAAAF